MKMANILSPIIKKHMKNAIQKWYRVLSTISISLQKNKLYALQNRNKSKIC